MSNQLERLIVDVELETAELRKGVEHSIEQLEKLGELAKSITGFEAFKELGKFALEAGEQLADFVVSGAEAADKMGKLASAAQVPVETFERLSYAAKLGGLSAEDMGGAFNKLNKALGEAALGGQTQSALFQALGVSLKDSSGTARSSSDIFTELAKKLDGLAPGYAKSTLEQELFGKSGARLDEVLHGVAIGMADAGGEADKLGLVLSEKAVKAATEFHDNLERGKMAVEGIATNVAGQLAPALSELTDKLLHSKDAGDAFRETADLIADGIRVLASVAVLVVGKLREVGTELAGVAAVGASLATGDFAGAAEAWQAQEEELAKVTEQTAEQLTTIWAKNSDAFKSAGDAHKKLADGILADQKRIEDSAKRMEESFREAKALAEKLANEQFAEVDTAHKTSQTTEQSVARQDSYATIGQTPQAAFTQSTAGFKDFYDALEQYTQAQIGINNEQAAAARAKSQFDVEGYKFAVEALESQEDIARKAKKAADAYEAFAQKAAQELQRDLDKMSQGIASAAGHFLSKLGELGNVVQSAVQGFQQGGWWGAIVAVIVEVFSRFKRFAEIQNNANAQLEGLIDQLGPSLGRLTDGFEKLQNSLGKMTETVGTALSPVLDEVGRILGSVGDLLGPIFGAIEEIIEPITNILHLFTGLAAVLDPLQWVIKLVGYLFTLIAIAFLEISNGIQTGISQLLIWLSNFLANFGLNDAAKAISDLGVTLSKGAIEAQHKAESMWAQLGDSVQHFFDDGTTPKKNTNIDTDVGAGAKTTTEGLDGLGKSATTTAKAMDKLTEQLTNLPEGFKVRLRILQATDPVGPLHHQQGGDLHVHAEGLFLSVDQLAEQLRRNQGTHQWRQQGFAK